jgi:hypothetical protein
MGFYIHTFSRKDGWRLFLCQQTFIGRANMDAAIKTKGVLSRKQAANFLGVCMTTLDRMNITRTKIRRRVLYRQSVLFQWLEKNTEAKP